MAIMIKYFVPTVLATLLAACGGPPGPSATGKSIASISRASVTDGNGILVSYLQSGPDGPPRIVLVHGTPGEAEGWADYLLAPPQGTQIVAVDRPGFGKSGPGQAVTSLVAQAQALEPFLRDAGARKPILVGHSLGGPIVAQAACLYPDRIGAIVIAAGSLDPGLEEIHWAQYLGNAPPISWLLPAMIQNANHELLALEPELEGLQPCLSRLTIPIVIIHGTKDDLVPFANVAFMRAQFAGNPNVQVIVLEGMNHFLPWGAMADMKRAISAAMEAAWGPAPP
ncbi:MAG TPA: alpha/beta hydrolase [Alphaproteobacteria bacterium]|nr:alpha/beta hydrolase [Alphaproteobacteria bacterium]HAJ48442.1 alpha/beta hydrolase [Alphaproteobacteria bacterium]